MSKALSRTIIALYRKHWGLFWRIMLPVSILAILLEIVAFFYSIPRFEKDINAWPDRNAYTVTNHVNTVSGVHLTIADITENMSTNTRDARRVDRRLDSGMYSRTTTSEGSTRRWGLNFSGPYFSTTTSEGITWRWGLNCRGFEYSVLILLLLTFCPVSLAVARISRGAEMSDNAAGEAVSPTAREMWRRTGHRALTVFGAFLLFILLVDAVYNLYGLALQVVPSLVGISSFALMSALFIGSNIFHIYFLLMLSLYNPCLILENRSVIGVFRRSYALVKGARLRFLGIYLLTGWIASVMTSVLFGTALLGLSVVLPDLAQVREALSPLKFLSLFIGGNIDVVLPQLLSVPATVALFVVKGVITTFLVPIWAILTTLLYLERVSDAQREAV